jgi:hypothetical protein
LSDVEFQIFSQIEDTVSFPIDSLVLGDGEPITNYLNSSVRGKPNVNSVHQTTTLGDVATSNNSQLKTFISDAIKEANTLSALNPNPSSTIQSKIAYSYGAKNYTVLSAYPLCKDSLYALDCSGYLWYNFNNAGANLPLGTADNQRQISVLKNAIKGKLDPKLFEVVNLSMLTKDKMIAGDIIYFFVDGSPIADHIGLIGQSSIRFFYHSFGNKTSCGINKSPDGGPIAWSFAKTTPGQLIVLKDKQGKSHTLSMNIDRIRYIAELEIVPTIMTQTAGATNNIEVKVYSSDSLPKVGFPVKFSTQDGTVTSQSITDMNGIAKASWTLSTNGGQQNCIEQVLSPVDNTTILDNVTFSVNVTSNSGWIGSWSGNMYYQTYTTVGEFQPVFGEGPDSFYIGHYFGVKMAISDDTNNFLVCNLFPSATQACVDMDMVSYTSTANFTGNQFQYNYNGTPCGILSNCCYPGVFFPLDNNYGLSKTVTLNIRADGKTITGTFNGTGTTGTDPKIGNVNITYSGTYLFQKQ